MAVKKKSGVSGRKKWRCKEGCQITATPCPHLEKLLPKEDSYSLLNQRQNYAGSNIDRYQPPVADRAKEKADFIKKYSDGLTPVEVDILVLRYVFDEEFGSIARELKLLGAETAFRVHGEALVKLRGRIKK